MGGIGRTRRIGEFSGLEGDSTFNSVTFCLTAGAYFFVASRECH